MTGAPAGWPRAAARRAGGWWRARLGRLRQDREAGRAMLEMVFLGVLVFVPVVYLILTLGDLQRASFAAAAAAREAGRVFVLSDTDAQGRARAELAAGLTFQDYRESAGNVTVTCDGAPCLRPGGQVDVTVSLVVTLPLVPDLIADRVPASVTVQATHRATVGRFRVAG